MGGPCEEVHEGATAIDIAKQNFAHVMATTDKAHEPMREQMTKPGKGPSKEEWRGSTENGTRKRTKPDY